MVNEKEKMLFIGSDSKWAIERFYLKELKEYYDVEFFNAHGRYLDYYHSSIKNKLIERLGLGVFIKNINKELLSFVENKDIDIAFIFKGMELYPSTIKKLKDYGVYLINFNPDHPFEYISRGSGNENVLKSISYYEHHFSYSKKIANDLKSKFNVSSSWLPFGYSYSKKPNIDDEVYNRLCFIGNPDKQRAEAIQHLIDSKIEVDVYGNNWNKFLSSSNYLRLNNAVYAKDFVDTARSYRMHINILRKQNFDSHNMRTFELPAIGCISLSPRTSEHLEFFEENFEAFYYRDTSEMIKQSKRILELSIDDAYQIKLNAYNKSIKVDYSYKKRTETIWSFLNNRS